MKRRIALTIALTALVVLVLLTNSDSSVQAQKKTRTIADTGVVTLGPNQTLRITVGANMSETVGDAFVQFKRADYLLVGSDDGIWRMTAASQTTTPPIRIGQGEAVSYNITSGAGGGNYTFVRGIGLADSSVRNVRVNAFIVNSLTGEIITAVDVPPVDVNLLG